MDLLMLSTGSYSRPLVHSLLYISDYEIKVNSLFVSSSGSHIHAVDTNHITFRSILSSRFDSEPLDIRYVDIKFFPQRIWRYGLTSAFDLVQLGSVNTSPTSTGCR